MKKHFGCASRRSWTGISELLKAVDCECLFIPAAVVTISEEKGPVSVVHLIIIDFLA